jgi:hypothetical protein
LACTICGFLMRRGLLTSTTNAFFCCFIEIPM